MELILMLMGVVTGVLCYRMGRREGEVGRVLPLIPSRGKPRREDELLDKVERYRGRKE